MGTNGRPVKFIIVLIFIARNAHHQVTKTTNKHNESSYTPKPVRYIKYNRGETIKENEEAPEIRRNLC